MNKQRKKRRAAAQRSSAAAQGSTAATRAVDWPRSAALCGMFSLVAATPLIPSEGVSQGYGVPLAMGWLALAVVWWSVLTLQSWRRVVVGGAMFALLALVAWSLIGAVMMAGEGNSRHTINMACQWTSYAAMFFMARQLLLRDDEQRALIALLIFLAVTLSVHATHQYFVSLPATARSFLEASEDEQRAILQSRNIDPDPDSPERRHFVDRIGAREPFATFSLSNSFAAMLAPILTLTLAIGQVAWSAEKRHAMTLAGLAIAAVLISLALLLTESRTSFLAAGFGLLLLAGLGVVQGRVSWKIPVVGVALLLALLTGAVLVGEIDSQILSSAWKSAFFRLEYWQSTLAMIADYPLMGCGVGNFQAYYAAYKLPQASETVSDPHNLVLEVCANAGIPALLALIALVVLTLRSGFRREPPETDDAVADDSEHEETAKKSAKVGELDRGEPTPLTGILLLGALLGLILAFAVGGLVDFIPDLMLFCFALVGLAVAGTLSPWVRNGRLTTSALVVALLVLLLNLMVSGGFSYPGVSQIGWLLLALILNRRARVERAPHRTLRLATTIGVAAVTFAGLQLAYFPLRARHMMANPLIRQSAAAAEIEFLSVAQMDGFWDEPWKQLASLYLGRYLGTADDKDFTRFETSLGEVLKRNQRSYTVRRQIGDWYLAAYRYRGNRQHLNRSLIAYQQAVDRFPNSHGLRAQLSWALHVAGQTEEAAEQAARSLEIDEAHPHAEQKLRQLRIYDPGPQGGADQTPGPGGDNVEQWMLRLRKTRGGAALPNSAVQLPKDGSEGGQE